MRYSVQIILVVLSFAALAPVGAEERPAGTLSLKRAVAIAVSDNPGLAEMRSRYQALAEVPSQVTSLPDPTVTLGAMNFPTDTFNRAQEPMTQLQLGISQTFPFPGKIALRGDIAELSARAAAHSADEARLQLVRRVKHQWWQLYYVNRAMETVARNQGLLEQLIKVAKTKYETGKGLQQDVLLAQLELSKLIDQEIQLEAVRGHQVIQLNTLMDEPPAAVIRLPEDVDLSTPELLPDEQLMSLADASRPLLQRLDADIDTARARLELARRDYYPDFNVGLVHGERTGSNPAPRGGDRADFLSLMVGVKIPLYAGRKQSRAVSQRNIEVQTRRYALLDERGLVRSAIAQSRTDYVRATRQLVLFKTGVVPQAEQTVESMLAGYQVSEVDFLNLVRSQMTLLDYELQYWKALSEAKQALAELQAIVGQEAIYE